MNPLAAQSSRALGGHGVAAAALKLAERGIPVFPVDGTSKRPRLVRHGVLDATTDVGLIESWWRLAPDAGVAIATGKPSRVVVVDVDPRHGGNHGFDDLSDRLGSLPAGPIVTTPSGGFHRWLRLPAGADIRNSAGRLADGVDVRGTGGYVVAPPTSGHKGAWCWSGRRGPLPETPAAWLEAMTQPTDRWAPVPASEWVAILSDGVGEGTRHDSMIRLVGHLLGKRLDVDVVVGLAHCVNTAKFRPPLPADEVTAILDGIAAREAAKRTGARS